MEQFEKIFYTANTISNPSEIVSALAPVAQNCATTKFPETLINYVGEVAEKRPRDIETICKALSLLMSDSQIREKPFHGEDYPSTFLQAFSMALSETIDGGLGDVYAEDVIGNLSIDSTNIRLTAALLSASAIKHNLQHVDQRIPQGIVLLGLQDPNPLLMPEPKKNEVYGVVALIHLAVIGDIMGEIVDHRLFIDGGVSVIHALKSLKKKHVFKSPSSLELLEHVIVNVKSGYKKNMSANEVWDLLFPGEDGLGRWGGGATNRNAAYVPYNNNNTFSLLNFLSELLVVHPVTIVKQ